MREINTIIVHCLDTYTTMDVGFKEVEHWHRVERGWSGGCGYHYIIKRDGNVEKGREDGVAGAHCKGYNHDSIGVALAGGKGDDNTPEANFTASQWKSLEDLCTNLKWTHNAEIKGHCEMPGVTKTCPNFNVSAWAETI